MTNDVFIEGIQENVHDNSACILSSLAQWFASKTWFYVIHSV